MWTAADILANDSARLNIQHYADWRICSPPYLEIHNASELPSIQQAVRNRGLSFPLGLLACLTCVHIQADFKTDDFYIESYLMERPQKHFFFLSCVDSSL